MGNTVSLLRSGRRRRPVWFDVEDRERIIDQLNGLFRGIWQIVQKLHRAHPPTGIGRKALKAATIAEEAGVLLSVPPGFLESLQHDALGMAIKRMYINNDVWIENMWFPVVAKFNGKLLWDTLTPDPRSREKWRKRLTICDKTLKDLELGQDVTVTITQRLLEEVINRSYSEEALKKRLLKSRKRIRENR